jgi:hypothetical protein
MSNDNAPNEQQPRPLLRSVVPYETLVDKGLTWLADKGVAVALLIGLAAFFAYDKLFMQPGRDDVQREHERDMQQAWREATNEIIQRIEKTHAETMTRVERENQMWRQAVLEAKFGKTETLRGMMNNGSG